MLLTYLIIFAANYLFLASFLISGWFFLQATSAHRRSFLKLVIPSFLLILLWAKTLNYFIHNPRPFVVGEFTPLIPHIPNNGFPSDHTLLVSAIAAAVTCFDIRLGILLWLVTVAVAAARVLAGVHHTVDVVASCIISIFVTGIVYWLVSIKRIS